MISSYRYTLNPVGYRTAVEEYDGRRVDYNYDLLYRLTQEQITDTTNGNRTTAYTYDPVGNRLTQSDSVEGDTTYIYDANDRLLSEVTDTETTTYGYDNNGNTLSKLRGTDQTLYDWDYENRLIGATVTTAAGAQQLAYQYNSDGIRVASVVDGQETRYLIDTMQPYAQVLEEYTPDGTVLVSYVYGHDLISQERSGNQIFYHVDGLGSTRVLTDINGNVTDTGTYGAFGELIASSGSTENSYGFAGEQFDSGLDQYYLRARYYDQSSGRFTRRDDYEGRLGEPLTLHKYLYANGNPVNLSDPSGFYSLEIGYKAFHVDVVVSDKNKNRVYGAEAQNLRASPDHLGLFVNSSGSQGGSVGFGNIATYAWKDVDRSDYSEFQVLLDSGRDDDEFPWQIEQHIKNSFNRIQQSQIPYNFHRSNSNSTAFQVLEETLGYRPIPTRFFLPGWNRNPYTGLRYDGTIAIFDRVTIAVQVSTTLYATTLTALWAVLAYVGRVLP